MKTAVNPAISGWDRNQQQFPVAGAQCIAEPWRACCALAGLSAGARLARRRRRPAAGPRHSGAGGGGVPRDSRSSSNERASSRERSSWSVRLARRSLGTDGRLDRDRVDLGVEAGVERQLVGQPAIEGDPAAFVDAEK